MDSPVQERGQRGLELVWPGAKLTKAIRLGCTVDMYRSLTGDLATSEESLGTPRTWPITHMRRVQELA